MNNDITNPNQLYAAVEKSSLSNLLDDRERNMAVKRHLKPGIKSIIMR